MRSSLAGIEAVETLRLGRVRACTSGIVGVVRSIPRATRLSSTSSTVGLTANTNVSQRLDKKRAYLVSQTLLSKKGCLFAAKRTHSLCTRGSHTEPRTERKMGLRQGRLPAMMPTQDSMIVHRVTCHEISVRCEAQQGSTYCCGYPIANRQ